MRIDCDAHPNTPCNPFYQPKSWLDKVNYIVSFWEDPCEVPWTVGIRLALPAAGDVVMNIASFGMGDVVRSMFRPKPVLGGRSWRHTRRGRKGGKAGAGLLSPGENIGHQLRGSTFLPTASDSRKLDFLWQIDGIQQAGLFYWMVADVSVDGLYHWTSLLQQSGACSGVPFADLAFAKDSGTYLPLLQWQGTTMDAVHTPPPGSGWIWGPAGADYTRGNYVAYWWGEAFNPNPHPVSFRLGYWNLNSTTEDPDLQSDLFTCPPFSTERFYYPEYISGENGAIMAIRPFEGVLQLNVQKIRWIAGEKGW